MPCFLPAFHPPSHFRRYGVKAVHCPSCSDSILGPEFVVCGGCQAFFHRACWTREGRCAECRAWSWLEPSDDAPESGPASDDPSFLSARIEEQRLVVKRAANLRLIPPLLWVCLLAVTAPVPWTLSAGIAGGVVLLTMGLFSRAVEKSQEAKKAPANPAVAREWDNHRALLSVLPYGVASTIFGGILYRHTPAIASNLMIAGYVFFEWRHVQALQEQIRLRRTLARHLLSGDQLSQ